MKDKKLLILMLMSVSSVALAASPGDYTAQFEAMDMDNDGLVSVDEVTDSDDLRPGESWDDYDLDADGQMNYAEFANYQWRTAGSAGYDTDFSTMDMDNDSYLSRDEVATDEALAAGWSDYDLNADQRLDTAEYNQYRIRTAGAEWGDDFTTMDTDRDTYLTETEMESDRAFYPRYSDFDLNDDQRIDQTEYTQYRIETAGGVGDYTADFNEMDMDRDGYISADEAMDDDDLTSAWTDYDLDDDDMLNEDEYAGYRMD